MDSGLLLVNFFMAALLFGANWAQVMPENTAAIVGDSVTMSCENSGGSKFRWFKDGTKIAQNSKIKIDDDRYTLDDDLDNGVYNLEISAASVVSSDGGTYSCRFWDGSQNVKYFAELIILADPVVCNPEFLDSNGDPIAPEDDLQADDTMKLYCTLGLSGKWAPEINCTETGFDLVTSTNYSAVNLGSYYYEYTLQNSISSASVECEAAFASLEFPTGSGKLFFADNVPDYTSTDTVDDVSIEEQMEDELLKFEVNMPWWVIFLLVIFIVAAAVGLIVGIICSCKSSN